MAAAVADFRPKKKASQKIKKQSSESASVELERTADILTMLSAQRSHQLLVGFAAETEQLVAHATHKLKTKGLDLIVANDVTREGAGFGSDRNAATLIDREGMVAELAIRPKRQMADDVLDHVVRLLRAGSSTRRAAAKAGGR
jgi:phosphopantothenoylcysteine decarboxylase/phosphopantothenate--cysteine ligase